MAAPRKIPIHFISSGGVLKLGGSRPANDGSDGYVASKWASERVLENAAKALGLPVVIHRTLPATDNSGLSSPVLEQFLDLTRQMKTLPFATGWTGEMDLLPIDTVAKGICNAASDDQVVNTAPRYITYRAEVKLSAGELSEYLESQIGDQAEFTRMPGLEWVGKIKSLGFGYFIASQKMILDAGGKWAKSPLVSSA